MSIIENILKTLVLDEAFITEKSVISNSAFRIRLQSESIRKNDFIPGSFLRLGIGIGKAELSMKDKIRSYSVWDINKEMGCLDLAIATHSHGIGSQWAKECKEGDSVYFKWKKGNFLPDNSADSYVMVGDLSALSHLYMINRSLGKGKNVSSLLYSQRKSDLFPDVNGDLPFDFYELGEDPSAEIISKIRELASKLPGKKMAYLAGDSRVCVTLNKFLRKELNWETKQIKTKPFWNPEKKGLE